jgi:hypothetical protein
MESSCPYTKKRDIILVTFKYIAIIIINEKRHAEGLQCHGK